MGLIKNLYQGATRTLQRGRAAINEVAERSAGYQRANDAFHNFQNYGAKRIAEVTIATGLLVGSALLGYNALTPSRTAAQETRHERPAVVRTIEQEAKRDLYMTPRPGEGLWNLVERAETAAKKQNPGMTIKRMSAGTTSYQNVKENDRVVANIIKEIQYDKRNASIKSEDTVMRPGYYQEGSDRFTPTGPLQAGKDGLDDLLHEKDAAGQPQRVYVGTVEGTVKQKTKSQAKTATYTTKQSTEKNQLPLGGLAGLLGAGALLLYLKGKKEGGESREPEPPTPGNGRKNNNIIDLVYDEATETWELPSESGRNSVDALANSIYQRYDKTFREAGAEAAYKTGGRALMNPALRSSVALEYYRNPAYALQRNGEQNDSYLSIAEISRLTGVSAYQMQKLAKHQGVSRRAMQQTYIANRREKAAQLRSQGASTKDIAEELGVSTSTVRRDLRKPRETKTETKTTKETETSTPTNESQRIAA